MDAKLNVVEHEEMNHGREWFKYEGPVTVDMSEEEFYDDEVTSQWWILDYGKESKPSSTEKYWGMYPAGKYRTTSREKPVVCSRADNVQDEEVVKKFLFHYFTSKIIRVVKTYEVYPHSGVIVDEPKDLSTSSY